MSDFQIIVSVVALAWLATFASVQAMHAYFRHLDFRVRYVLGTIAICGGCTAAGIALENVLLAVVPWVLASAGATIIVNYAAEERRAKEQRAARQEGEIVGMTRSLTQELIDNGGASHARKSDIHDPGRRN
mgnify:FL=1